MSTSQPDRITVEEFAETTMKAFMRAIEARDRADRFPFGPIVFGWIFWPEGTLPGKFGTFGVESSQQDVK